MDSLEIQNNRLMHMQAARTFFNLHRYYIAISFILIAAVFLRFYDLSDRFGLAYDQARDLLVAREALHIKELPLIGPFASAGQFVYGPQWYWILIGFIFLTPGWFLGPWVVLGVLYCICIYLMTRIGQMIGGKKLAVIVGILVAVSPGGIAQSVNLSSPSMAGVLSIVSLFFFVRYITRKKAIDGFLLAFCIGTAIMVHFQAIGLLFLLLVVGVFGKRSLKNYMLLFTGFVLPLIPLIYFDFTNNFFESRNILDYYFHVQQRIYYPNRWLTYLGTFWPGAWARITGGEVILGYVGFFGCFLLAALSFYKKRLSNKSVLGMGVVFFFNIIMLRYYKGQLFDSYLVFLHGIIIIVTALLILHIYQWKKVIGFVFLILFIFGSLKSVYLDMRGSANGTFLRSEAVARVLNSEFPGKTISVYDYKYMSPQFSLPIALYLDYKGKLSNRGISVGITSLSHAASMSALTVIDPSLDVAVFNLSASSEARLSTDGWGRVNPSDVYNSTVLWYKENGK